LGSPFGAEEALIANGLEVMESCWVLMLIVDEGRKGGVKEISKQTDIPQ
jgi:hypothetical protein